MSGIEPAVRVEELSKRFGARWALDGINLVLREGESISIFGPNGAGKTTLLRILAALLRPTSGTVTLFGEDSHRGDWPRIRLGFLSHRSFLYPHLTGFENLAFFGRLYNLSNLESRIRNRAEQVGLGDRMQDPVQTFSRGMEQRLAIARALLHDPDLLFLDEPFAGIDPVGANQLSCLFSRLREEGRSILLATHHLAEGYALGDHLLILNSGRLAFSVDKNQTTLEQFRARFREVVQSSNGHTPNR